MATTSNTKSVTGSSGTYDSGSFLKQTWSETTAAGANTYAINADATSAKLSLRGSGDAIYVNGLVGEYQVKASGKTVTLKSDITGQTISIVLNSVSKTTVVTNTIYFIGGSLTLGNSSGSTALKLGDQSLSSKYKLITAEPTDSSTADTYFDGTSSNTSGVTLEDGIKTNDGTSGDDVWEGDTMGGASATLEDGDTINGYAGNDTLNIKAKGDSATFVMNSVETVNVELWSAQSYDMARWSGVQTVNISNNSTDDLTLTLTNAQYDTTFKVSDDNDLSVSYKSGLTTGTAKLALNGAGSSGDNAAITVTGAQQAVSITASGVNYATIDASAEAVTVVGNGTITLSDSDVVSSLSYAGFSGTTTTTIGGASNLVFTGGAGNDSLNITGLTSADTLTGGAGTDTLIASYGTSTVLQGVSGFEVAKFALTEASTTFAMNGSPFTTLEISGVSAAASDVNISGVAAGVSINLNAVDTSMDNLNIGYATGVTAVITAKASGAATFGGASTISGAGTVTLTVDGASATQSFSGLSITDATTVSLAAGGSGTLDVNGLFTLTDATRLTASASGVGSITHDAAVVASGLTTITATNAGSSTTSLWLGKSGGFSLNTGSHTIVADAGLGDLELGSVTVGDGANDTITLTVGTGGRLNSAAGFAYTASSGTVSLNTTVGGSATATLGAVNAGTSGTVAAYNVTVGANSTFSAGNITAKTMTGLSVAGASEASATVGNLAIGSNLGNITLSQAASGTVIVGTVAAATGIANITISGGQAASITTGVMSAQSVGDLNAVAADGATLSLGRFEATSGTFGTITLNAGSAASITLASVSGAESASATDTVGAISITGNSGSVTVTNAIAASASIGAITIGDGARVSVGGIEAKSIGNITASGDALTLTKVSATTIGNITLAGSGASVTLGGALTTVGSVTISGSGQQTVDFASATTIGTISTVNNAGTATLTLTNVKGAESITLGTGTNYVYVGTGTAAINLSANTGTDRIYLAGSGNDGITTSNFQLLSSATDKVYLNASAVAGFSLGFASAASFGSAAADTALTVALVTASGVGFSLASGAGGANTDVFVLATGSYTTIQGALSQLGTLVSATSSNLATAGSDVLVLWYDSVNDATKLTLVNTTAGTYDKTFTSTFNGDTNTLITFSGVDIRGVSGVSFTDKFISY